MPLSRFGGTLLLIFLSAFAVFPNKLSFPADQLDASWRFALNAAAANYLLFGKEIVFTFGPYVEIFSAQYHPTLFFTSLLGNLFLTAVFGLGFYVLSGRLRSIRSLLLLALVLPFANARDALFFSFPLMLLLVASRFSDKSVKTTEHDKPEAFALIGLSAGLGLIPLIKGTFAIGAGMAMAFSCLIIGQSSRVLAASMLATFIATMLSLWALTGYSTAELAGYFKSLAPVVSGFTDAMSLQGRFSEIAAYIIGALLLLHTFWRALQLGAKKVGYGLAILGIGGVLFLTFKSGFVRHDDAHSPICTSLILLFSVFIFAIPSATKIRMILLICFLGVFVFAKQQMHLHTTELPTHFFSFYQDSLRSLYQQTFGKAALDQHYNAQLAEIQRAAPLPPVSGATDIYAYDQSVLLANHLQWSTRPVLQSYAAYTPKLAMINAKHLSGGAAPENIFFALQTIDHRYPSLDDGPSWPALLTRYRFDGTYGNYLLLRKSPSPTFSPKLAAPVVAREVTLGEDVAIAPQQSSLLWAQMEIKPTLLGKLARQIFKLPELRLAVQLPSGRNETYRLVADMAAAGFLLSPLVENTQQFASLAQRDIPALSPQQLTSVRVEAVTGAGLLWQNSYRLIVQPLVIGSTPADVGNH